MPRLTIAAIAALGFHVLLLMMVFPEHEVVEPEVKGSGHVTVSIMRRQAPVPEVIEELVENRIRLKRRRKRSRRNKLLSRFH